MTLGDVATNAGSGTPATGSARRWLALALAASAQLMLVLDVTVVNVALPDIGRALQLSQAAVPWVLTLYTLVFGGLMLLGGRAADLLGARRVLLAGLALFTASSAACTLATDATTLLAGRALQGLGAALLSPAALAVVMQLFTGADRARALSVWSALSGVGAALGVILGGILTSGVGWRWIFAINLPIGLVILLVLPALVPVRHRQRRHAAGRLDIPGAVLVTAGTSALIYALVNAGVDGWTATETIAPLTAAVGLLTAFVAVERATTTPLLDVRLLREGPVSAAAFLMLVATGLLVGGFFLGSFALQRQHDYSAIRVGVAFLPLALATVLGAHTAGHLLTLASARLLAPSGLALAAAGYAVAQHWPRPLGLVTGLSIAALGIGAVFVTAFTSALADAGADEAGLRSAIVGTCHELGGALGVAVLATAVGTGLTAANPTAEGYSRGFVVGTISALAAVPLAAAFVPAVVRPADSAAPHH